MFLKRMDPAHLEAAYGILVQEVYPWPEAAATPFGAVWAVVEPGQRTKHHNHQEGETFFVTAGRGRYRVGDEVVEVGPGDVVFQPPFNSHVIENASDSENLVFLAVYWEDLHLWNAKQAAALFEGERPARALVTAAPSSAAGELQLGELAGPYLAADILARYLRLRGAEVSFACRADDRAGLLAAGVAPDLWIGGPDAPLQAVAEELFTRLLAGGKLVEREGVELACAGCGSPCEGAAGPALAAEDVDAAGGAVCAECGGRPVPRAVRRLYFPLSRYAGELAELYLKAGMSARQRALREEVAAAGLPDLPASRTSGRGFPVPAAGHDGQVLSPWIEGAACALAAARAAGTAAGAGEALVADCFADDDLFLHGLAVPALLLAFDPEIRPATAFVSNEPYRAAGEGLAVGELLGRMPADLLRFHLAHTRPETEAADFRLAELAATVERELAGGWQPWLSDLAARLAAERGGAIPATGDWTEDHRRFYARLQELVAAAAAGYEPRSFSPQQATRACAELVRVARRFGKAEAHWQKVAARSEERRTGLALELLAVKALALMAAPVMPDLAARLWRELGFETPLGEARWEDRPAWLPAGQLLRGLGGPYFAPVRAPAAMAQAVA